MTEKQKEEIENIKTIPEWDQYILDNNIKRKDRILDEELGNALHKKRFQIFGEIIKKNGGLNFFKDVDYISNFTTED